MRTPKTIGIKPEQVPDTAAQAAHDVFWNAVYNGKPIDLEIEFDQLFHYAIAAAINAWPGIEVKPTHEGYPAWPHIILPIQDQKPKS